MVRPTLAFPCLDNSEKNISVNGVLDDATQRAFEKFGEQYNVPAGLNFSMFKALELNRILDVNIASEAWSAYAAYKNGIVTPPVDPVRVPSPKTSVKASPKPAAPAPSSPDYDSALEGLL